MNAKKTNLKKYLITALLATLTLSFQSKAIASPASDLLFSGVKTSISQTDKESIAKLLDLTLSKDGKNFVDEAGVVGVTVQEMNLNNDKTPEIFVSLSSPLYGMAGSNLVLYIKDASGKYNMNLGFPGAEATPLATKTNGYQDLKIGGPGFECPIWKWNGKEYDFSHKVKC